MAQGTLFVGWGAIIPGREKTASKVLGQAMGYLQGLKAEGTVDSVDVVLLEPHGGELEGFVLVRGEKSKLAELRVDERFVKVIVGVQLVHTKVGVVGGYSGAEMQSLLQIWDQQESALR
jgi:hypothetical protein